MQFFLMANCFVFGAIMILGGVTLMALAIAGEKVTIKNRVWWAAGGLLSLEAGVALFSALTSLA